MIQIHPILKLLVLTLAVPFLVSCTTAPPPDTSAEDRQAIQAATKQWVDNYNSGNIDALVALYTEEAKLLEPNSQMIVGRESIQAIYQGFIDASVRDLQHTTIDLQVSRDMAYVDGKSTTGNKYVEIWRLEDGTWKMDVDIWNSSVPLPVPEEEAPEEME